MFQRPMDLKSVFMFLEQVASKRSCAVSLPKGPGSLGNILAAQFQRISTFCQARAYRHQRLAVRRGSCRRNPAIRWFRSRPKIPRQAAPPWPGKKSEFRWAHTDLPSGTRRPRTRGGQKSLKNYEISELGCAQAVEAAWLRRPLRVAEVDRITGEGERLHGDQTGAARSVAASTTTVWPGAQDTSNPN